MMLERRKIKRRERVRECVRVGEKQYKEFEKN